METKTKLYIGGAIGAAGLLFFFLRPRSGGVKEMSTDAGGDASSLPPGGASSLPLGRDQLTNDTGKNPLVAGRAGERTFDVASRIQGGAAVVVDPVSGDATVTKTVKDGNRQGKKTITIHRDGSIDYKVVVKTTGGKVLASSIAHYKAAA